MKKVTWTPEAIRALGVRTTVPIAGEILAGLCKDESYRMAARGAFPVPVVKVGRRLVVPVAPILALLRIPETDTAETAPPVSAATTLAVPTPRSTTTNDDTPSTAAAQGRDAA